MQQTNCSTRQHIIDTTAALLRIERSERVKITDIAATANVSVPTIYYHFGSKESLIARTQKCVYAQLSSANESQLVRVESAVTCGDESEFWDALTEDLDATWSRGPVDESLGHMKILLDIWSDPRVRWEYLSLVNDRYVRWLDALTAAKRLGWIARDVDVEVPLALFWSATCGQIVLGGRKRRPISGGRVVDYLLGSLRDSKVY